MVSFMYDSVDKYAYSLIGIQVQSLLVFLSSFMLVFVLIWPCILSSSQ